MAGVLALGRACLILIFTNCHSKPTQEQQLIQSLQQRFRGLHVIHVLPGKLMAWMGIPGDRGSPRCQAGLFSKGITPRNDSCHILWEHRTGASDGSKREPRTSSAGNTSDPLKFKDYRHIIHCWSSFFPFSLLLSFSPLFQLTLSGNHPITHLFLPHCLSKKLKKQIYPPWFTFISSALPKPCVFLRASSKTALQAFSKTGETSDSNKNV